VDIEISSLHSLNTTFYTSENLNVKLAATTGDFDNLKIGSYEVPANSSYVGTVGQIAFSQDHIYMCVAPDTWRRWPISDF
jgi:hypothetical protein